MFSFDNDAVRVAEVFGLRFGLGVRLLATDSRVPAWSVNGMIFDFLALVCLLWQRRLLLNPSSVRIAKAAKIIQLQASVRGMCVIANRAVVSRMRDAFERYKVEQTKLILRSIELQRNGRRGLRDDAETATKFSANFNQFSRALDPTTEQAVEEEADAITRSEEDELRSQLHISDDDENDEAANTEASKRKSTSFSLGALSRSMTGFLPWARRGETGESGDQVPNQAVSEPSASGEPEVTADQTPNSSPRRVRQSASTSALDTLAKEEGDFRTLPSSSVSSAVGRASARRRSRVREDSHSPVHELSIEEERGDGTDHTTTDDEDEDEDKSDERSRAAATAEESKTEEGQGGGMDTEAEKAGKCKRMCSR